MPPRPLAAFVRRPAVGLAALFALCGFADVERAAAEAVRVHYDLSLIGIPLGFAEAKATIDPDRYSIELEAKLTGIAALVTSAKGAAKASGSIVDGRIAPTDYATTSANSHMTRTVRMAMNLGDVSAVDIEPPIIDDTPGRIPVTADDKRNIVDPVSALVMTIPPSAKAIGPAACDRTLPVFDGYTRFDIKLTYIGVRRFRIPGYDGQVSVCAARYIPIAGHHPNRPGTVFMEHNKHLQVWLAPLPADHVELPMRISIETMVGTTVAEATAFSVGGHGKGSAADP